jgi:hypothetical protein
MAQQPTAIRDGWLILRFQRSGITIKFWLTVIPAWLLWVLYETNLPCEARRLVEFAFSNTLIACLTCSFKYYRVVHEKNQFGIYKFFLNRMFSQKYLGLCKKFLFLWTWVKVCTFRTRLKNSRYHTVWSILISTVCCFVVVTFRLCF